MGIHILALRLRSSRASWLSRRQVAGWTCPKFVRVPFFFCGSEAKQQQRQLLPQRLLPPSQSWALSLHWRKLAVEALPTFFGIGPDGLFGLTQEVSIAPVAVR